ncbi:MAG: urea carboxylase-associated family protein [Chloroflexi bacterium]|nr:urea carboxylase-associated family protein [Chloroflexota bacterium]
MKTGQRLRVTDVDGKQCFDLCVFNRTNPHEKLSTTWSRTRRRPKAGEGWSSADRMLPGDVLLSTLCRPMLTITQDTTDPPGIHDTHIRMCDAYLYEIHGLGPYKGCFEIVSEVIAPYGIAPEDIPDPFNGFLNLQYDCDTKAWIAREPVTKPGDYIEFVAEMDCLIAISNCPEDRLTDSSGKKCTPLRVQVFA